MAEFQTENEGLFSSTIRWLKENLFYNIWSTFVTFFCIYFVICLGCSF